MHERGGVLDCHLMVDNPERHIPQVARAGGDSVTFHVEVTDDPASLIALAREHGLGVGVAFNPDTAVEDAARAAEGADIALCMSIVPGYSGQAFMPEALERIARLRELLPGTPIQVDGGIAHDTIRPAYDAGASLFVAGTAIFGHGDLALALPPPRPAARMSLERALELAERGRRDDAPEPGRGRGRRERRRGRGGGLARAQGRGARRGERARRAPASGPAARPST